MLYLCGGSGFGTPDADSPHHLPAAGWSEPSPGVLQENAHQRVDFLADLFDGKILYEWNLAKPTAKASKRIRRRALTLQILVFAGLLLGPLALWAGVRLSSSRATDLSDR